MSAALNRFGRQSVYYSTTYYEHRHPLLWIESAYEISNPPYRVNEVLS